MTGVCTFLSAGFKVDGTLDRYLLQGSGVANLRKSVSCKLLLSTSLRAKCTGTSAITDAWKVVFGIAYGFNGYKPVALKVIWNATEVSPWAYNVYLEMGKNNFIMIITNFLSKVICWKYFLNYS